MCFRLCFQVRKPDKMVIAETVILFFFFFGRDLCPLCCSVLRSTHRSRPRDMSQVEGWMLVCFHLRDTSRALVLFVIQLLQSQFFCKISVLGFIDSIMAANMMENTELLGRFSGGISVFWE